MELLVQVGGRIKKIRQELNMNQNEFANLIGSTKGGIYKYEAGKVAPGMSVLNAIRQKTGADLNWLVCGEGSRFFYEQQEHTSLIDQEYTLVPLLNSYSKDLRDIKRYIPFGKHFLADFQSSNLILLRNYADNMSPEIKQCDVIMIDISQKKIITNFIYAFFVQENVVIYRSNVSPQGIMLTSSNKYYPDLELNKLPELDVIGKIVWSCRDIPFL